MLCLLYIVKRINGCFQLLIYIVIRTKYKNIEGENHDTLSRIPRSKLEIYRSEIIDVVQNIDGISHCSLRQPETSIFFNFKLKELTEDQLLAYGPEYIYFTEDSITVRVV